MRQIPATCLALVLAWASPAAAAPEVVASIKPVHSLAAGVMEGVGPVHLTVPGGQSPHTYSLRPSDAKRLGGADLVVWVGPALESFLERPIAEIAPEGAAMRLLGVPGLTLLPVRAGGVWEGHAHDAHGSAHEGEHDHGHDQVHEDEHAGGHDHDHAHGNAEPGASSASEIDPHVWLDPDNARRLVTAIAERLARIDPDNAARYGENAAAMRARLDAAERDAAERLAPVRGRPFMVFHDAYQYFEAHFGLNAVGSITLSPDRRPGARRLVEIRARIAETGAPCLFREPQFPPDLVETVIEGTQARTAMLDPLGLEQPAGPEAMPGLIRSLAGNLAGCLAPAN